MPHYWYYTPNIKIIRRRKISWEGHVAHMGEDRDWWQNPEGNKTLERPKSRGKDNFKLKRPEGRGLE
jgi:hypothetical protein